MDVPLRERKRATCDKVPTKRANKSANKTRQQKCQQKAATKLITNMCNNTVALKTTGLRMHKLNYCLFPFCWHVC